MLAARIQEARPFALSDIPGMVAWFTPRALIGYSDGEAVGTWPNASGRGPDAVQATAGKRPIYKPNVYNGKAVLRFTRGNGHRMTSAMAEISQPITVFAVFKLASLSGMLTSYIFDSNDVTESKRQYIFHYSYNWKFYAPCSAGDITGEVAPPYGPVIWCITFNGVNSYIWINGVKLFGPASFYVYTMNGLSIGAASSDAGFWDGDIGEIIVFNAALTDTNRKLIEAYLGTEYGIAVTP